MSSTSTRRPSLSQKSSSSSRLDTQASLTTKVASYFPGLAASVRAASLWRHTATTAEQVLESDAVPFPLPPSGVLSLATTSPRSLLPHACVMLYTLDETGRIILTMRPDSRKYRHVAANALVAVVTHDLHNPATLYGKVAFVSGTAMEAARARHRAAHPGYETFVDPPNVVVVVAPFSGRMSTRQDSALVRVWESERAPRGMSTFRFGVLQGISVGVAAAIGCCVSVVVGGFILVNRLQKAEYSVDVVSPMAAAKIRLRPSAVTFNSAG
eukprot:TRINITY_DN68883_c0_g1_i1.p1 TRINITY_DN68883_c0_g1~~TRINITY_DN68883_c0_g1_i1.p1  ORF type:complete len:269 (-),score=23.69 TRINITY_DN68883_c0_g1_i1:82-888(-)